MRSFSVIGELSQQVQELQEELKKEQALTKKLKRGCFISVAGGSRSIASGDKPDS